MCPCSSVICQKSLSNPLINILCFAHRNNVITAQDQAFYLAFNRRTLSLLNTLVFTLCLSNFCYICQYHIEVVINYAYDATQLPIRSQIDNTWTVFDVL